MPPALTTRRPAILASIVLLVVISLEVVAILLLNEGHFAYVIDDAYIHLALSERIAHGHYGLNPGEAAAPASSLLWPFLLAPFASFEWHALVPLFLCAAAAVTIVFVAGEILREIMLSVAPAGPTKSTILLIGLVFTLGMPLHVLSGMEHLLHVAVTATAAMGLIVLVTTSRAPWWFFVALILSASIRYEGISILIAGTMALALKERYRAAAGVLVTGILPPVLFGYFLSSQGLPPIPSSVLVKSPIQYSDMMGTIVSVLRVIQHNVVFDRGGLVLSLLALCCLVKACRPSGEGILAWSAALVTGAYVVVGNPGTLGRYGLFVGAFDIFMLTYLWRRELVALAAGTATLKFGLLVILAVALFGPAQIKLIGVAPIMANNNWQQQHQLARFLTDYWRKPAGFTELGRMSYRNRNYVLDLWGIGSEEARKLRFEHASNWLLQITKERNVGVALIYDDWFDGSIPSEWRRVAVLEISRRNMVLPSPRMSIYATGPELADEVAAALAAFEPTLPAGSKLRTDL